VHPPRSLARAVVATVLAIACQGDSTPLSPDAANDAEGRPGQAAADEVARAIALALGRPELRSAVRDAMRDSDQSEHKLVLQDFLATPAGVPVLNAAAAADDRFTAMLATLPRMDFYVPFREHRVTWEATADVSVGATVDQDAPRLTAFTPEGGQLALDSREGAPDRPLLLLHPAELKMKHAHAAPRSPLQVIQAADEPDAPPVVAGIGTGELASVGPNPNATYLDYFNYQGSDGWGDAELVFTTWAVTALAEPVVGGYARGGIEPKLGYDVTQELNPRSPLNSDYVELLMCEDDNELVSSDDCSVKQRFYRELRMYMMKLYDRGGYLYAYVRLDWYALTNPIPVRLIVHPVPLVVRLGQTTGVETYAYDQANHVTFEYTTTWRSSNAAVATVKTDPSSPWRGLVSGVAPGTATLYVTACSTASPGSPCADGEIVVTVRRPAARVTITPGPVVAQHPATVQLTARVQDALGNVIDAPVTWRTADATVATVTSTGRNTATLTTKRVGYTYVYAKADEIESYTPVNAVGPVARVDVFPANASVNVGATLGMWAQPYDAGGSSVPGKTPSWSVDNPATATISAGGVLTGRAGGVVTVRATIDGVTGSRAVTVVAPSPVTSVVVEPSFIDAGAGQDVPVRATAYDAEGRTAAGRTFVWSSEDPAVARVRDDGEGRATVTAVAYGTTLVTVVVEGVQRSIRVTVEDNECVPQEGHFCSEPLSRSGAVPARP
jgi:hypothetical protein